MNDEISRVHQEIATRNSRTAIKTSESTRTELFERINHLENLVTSHSSKIALLEQKFNLLLTKRFDGKATAE